MDSLAYPSPPLTPQTPLIFLTTSPTSSVTELTREEFLWNTASWDSNDTSQDTGIYTPESHLTITTEPEMLENSILTESTPVLRMPVPSRSGPRMSRRMGISLSPARAAEVRQRLFEFQLQNSST